jgi:5-methylcytosine-specific restriction endonuclease McrA
MARQEFSKLTKQLCFARAKGHCEKCTAKLYVGKFDYDHILPAEFGGEATFDNCMVLCKNCHSEKTTKRDIPDIAKSNRLRNDRMGIRKRKRKLGYQLFNGTPVRPQ